MRISLSLPLVALILVATLSIPPAASATSFNLTDNKLGISGGLGTATVTRIGNDVRVTISMRPGYAIITDRGFLGFNLTGGLKLTDGALSSFSVGGITHRLEPSSSRAGFTFSQLFETDNDSGGQLFVSTLSFTIQNASLSEIAGLGVYFCVVEGNGCSATGYATGAPTSAVPEPGTLGLLGTGMIGMAALLRRRLS